MTARPIAQALAVALAGAAFATPAATAQVPQGQGAWDWPHVIRLDQLPAHSSTSRTTMGSLTDEEILASRGQGPPPQAAPAHADSDLDAHAIVGGTAIALLAVGTAVVARRRTKVTA